MNTFLRKHLSALLLTLGATGVANAQVVVYRDCVISDVAAFNAALTSFYESITGVEKPAAALNWNIFNGENPATHLLTEDFPDYEALEAWQNRVQESDGPRLQLFASVNSVATCETEGLAIETGSWGNQQQRGDYHIVYPISTTDRARYASALDQLSQSLIDDSPGPTALFTNRSGYSSETHYVVTWGPSLTALNEWMDEYPQTEAFQEFNNEVSPIRTVGPVVQRRTIATWNEE